MSETGIETKPGLKLFVDTAPVIYYIEKSPDYFSLLDPFFQASKSGAVQFITSTLTVIEVLTQPIRAKRFDLVKEYEDILLNSTFLRLISCDISVAKQASELRAKYNLKTPDAIQLASSIIAEADIVLTNDFELKKVSEIRIITLKDLIK